MPSSSGHSFQRKTLCGHRKRYKPSSTGHRTIPGRWMPSVPFLPNIVQSRTGVFHHRNDGSVLTPSLRIRRFCLVSNKAGLRTDRTGCTVHTLYPLPGCMNKTDISKKIVDFTACVVYSVLQYYTLEVMYEHSHFCSNT